MCPCSCRPHIWWIARWTGHPGCGRGRLHFHSPQGMHCATVHYSLKALVQSSQGSRRCWSHALCTCTAAQGGHLQAGLQTFVPTPVCALQANTLIYSNDSPAAKAGASTTLTVLVNNTDAPPSDLYLDGEHLHLRMMVHTMRGLGSVSKFTCIASGGRFSQRGRHVCMGSTLMQGSCCHERLPLCSYASICKQSSANVSQEGTFSAMHSHQHLNAHG